MLHAAYSHYVTLNKSIKNKNFRRKILSKKQWFYAQKHQTCRQQERWCVVNKLQPKNRDTAPSQATNSLDQLNKVREQIRNDVLELRQLQVELLEVLEENVLEMEKYFEKSAAGTVTNQELETLRVRIQLNKHLARYYKLASRQQQLLKEKSTREGRAYTKN